MSGQARQCKLAERTESLHFVHIELNYLEFFYVNAAVDAQASL